MHIFPQASDRTWTRAFYYAINRLYRRIEYERRAELLKPVTDAFVNTMKHGVGIVKIK